MRRIAAASGRDAEEAAEYLSEDLGEAPFERG